MPTTIDASFIDSLPPNVAVQFLERVAKSAHREAFRYPEGDAWAAIFVAAIVLVAAIRLAARNVDALMDRAPAGLAVRIERAVAAGAQVRMPVTDIFWGDRYAKVADPFGHEWGLATHKEDVSAREIGRRAEAFFSRMGGGS